MEGTFAGSGYLCQPCQEPCIECNYKATLCLRCNPTTPKPFALPSTLQCFAECPEGTYLDKEEGLCKICESPCFTCVNKTHCLSCDRDSKNSAINYFNQTLQCYETCPDISVPSPSKNCVSCASPCVRCQDKPDSCLSCEEGLFLLKDKCVGQCPFGYFKSTDDMKCLSTGELEVPFPFTIVAIIMSVGLGLSHFMKGSAKDNTEQEGTIFAISALAFVDLLLRINWIVLAVTSY